MCEPTIEVVDISEAVELGETYAWHSLLTLRDLEHDGYGDSMMAEMHRGYIRRYEELMTVVVEVFAALVGGE